jgi:hypothetical protein
MLDNQSIVRVVDYLAEDGYLDNYTAPRDTRGWIRKKERSSYRATQKLLDLFREDDVQSMRKLYIQTNEGVVMRDTNKVEIPYVESPDILKMRKIITDLNEMNDESLFTHNGKVICGSGIVRIFNEDFEQGGRWYRCSAQNIRQRDIHGNKLPLSETRLGIQIDEHPVVEVDYSCQHPILLCALKNLPVERFYGDVYGSMLPPDATQNDRSLFKIATNIMFNARTQDGAVGAIGKELLNEQHKDSFYQKNAQGVFDTIYATLVDFQPYFCQTRCTGLWLQNVDSKITEEIIKEFIRQEKPILPIHDSFIVKEEDCHLLQDTMEHAFRLVTRNMDWEVPVKTSYVDGTTERVLLGKWIGADPDSLCYEEGYIYE